MLKHWHFLVMNKEFVRFHETTDDPQQFKEASVCIEEKKTFRAQMPAK